MAADILHQALGPARQYRIAGQAEEEVGIAVGQDQRHQLGIGKVAVAAQQDMGLRPVAAQQADHPLHDHGVLGAGRAFAGAQHGAHQGAGVCLEHQQGQVAMVAVVRVVKRQRLLAIGGIVGVVQIQRDRDGGLRVAGDELLDQGVGQSVDIATPQRAFQAGVGGCAGQRIVGTERGPPGGQLEQRVVTQGIGIVAVLVTRGDLKNALGQQVAHRVGGVARIAGIADRLDQPPNQTDALIDGAQHQGAQVRGNLATGEVGANREARSGREAELFWRKIRGWASTGRHSLRIGF